MIRVFLLLLALSLQSCRPPADAEVIAEDFINRAESAIENRSITAIFDLLAQDYRDDLGRDRQDMRALAFGYLRQSKSVYLFTDLQDASLQTDSLIDCTLFVALAATPVSSRTMLPDLDGEFYWVDLKLTEDGSEWRAVRAAWRQAMLTDFLE